MADEYRANDGVKLVLIGIFAVIALLVTLYGILLQNNGIFLEYYYLVPHLYIIPIILVALWYPKRGTHVILLLIVSIGLLTGVTFIIRHTLDPVLSLLNAGIDVWIVAALALTARSRTVEDESRSTIPVGGERAGIGTEITDRPMDGYLDALKLPDERIRQEAVRALAGFDETPAILALVESLKDENRTVREEAIRSLGKLSSPDTIPPLLEVLKDEDRPIREQAAKALGSKGQLVLAPLLGALLDPDWHVRMGATIALRINGDVRSVEPLIHLLSDENRFVRREAVKSLGRLGDERAQNRLMDLREDPDQTVRLRAEVALMKIHGRYFAADDTNIPADKIEKL